MNSSAASGCPSFISLALISGGVYVCVGFLVIALFELIAMVSLQGLPRLEEIKLKYPMWTGSSAAITGLVGALAAPAILRAQLGSKWWTIGILTLVVPLLVGLAIVIAISASESTDILLDGEVLKAIAGVLMGTFLLSFFAFAILVVFSPLLLPCSFLGAYVLYRVVDARFPTLRQGT